MPVDINRLTEGWLELESDPGLFTLLLEDFGVEGVQVEEIYDLQKSLEGPVYGFIFLFRWIEERRSRRKIVDQSEMFVKDEDVVNNIFFAQQMVPNSCATHALLSVLLNCPNIHLGDTLSRLKAHTSGMSPENKGWAIGNTPELAKAHNSHAMPQAKRRLDKSSAVSTARYTGEAFHFVSYVPIRGRLFELDGLKPFPMDHGPWGEKEDWTEKFRRVIADRLGIATGEQYHDIRFNLMAVVPDRRLALTHKLKILKTNRQIVLEALQQLVKLTLPELTNGKEDAMENNGGEKKESETVKGNSAENEIVKKEVQKNNEDEKIIKVNGVHVDNEDKSPSFNNNNNNTIAINSDGKTKDPSSPDSDSNATRPILETRNYAKIAVTPSNDGTGGKAETSEKRLNISNRESKAEKPAAEEPAVEKSAAENLAAEKPEAEKPAAEKPETEKPAAEKPEAEKPAAEKPEAEKPAAEKPTAEEPAAEKSAAEQPAAEKPAAKKPAMEKLAAEKHAVEKPAAEKTTVEKPVAKKPAAEKHAVEKTEAKKSAAEKLAAGKTAAEKPASTGSGSTLCPPDYSTPLTIQTSPAPSSSSTDTSSEVGSAFNSPTQGWGWNSGQSSPTSSKDFKKLVVIRMAGSGANATASAGSGHAEDKAESSPTGRTVASVTVNCKRAGKDAVAETKKVGVESDVRECDKDSEKQPEQCNEAAAVEANSTSVNHKKVDEKLCAKNPEIFEPHTFAPKDLLALLKNLENEINVCELNLRDENDKRKKYKIDDCRRTHNYDEFICTFLSMLAQQGKLADLVQQHLLHKKPVTRVQSRTVKKPEPRPSPSRRRKGRTKYRKRK